MLTVSLSERCGRHMLAVAVTLGGLATGSVNAGGGGGGTALSFANDAVQVPHAAFDGLGDFTVEFWVNFAQFENGPDGTNTMLSLASAGPPINDNHFTLFQHLTNHTLMVHFQGDHYLAFTGSLAIGQWHHIAVVREGAQLRAFINGQGTGENHSVSSAPLAVSPGGAWLGNDQDCVGGCMGQPGQALYGVMDEICVWNEARTAEQISQDMTCGHFGDERGLVAYWNLNDPCGQSVADSGPSGLHGTLGQSTGPDAMDPVWVLPSGAAASCCPSDIDGDGMVGVTDFLILLGDWGACP